MALGATFTIIGLLYHSISDKNKKAMEFSMILLFFLAKVWYACGIHKSTLVRGCVGAPLGFGYTLFRIAAGQYDDIAC